MFKELGILQEWHPKSERDGLSAYIERTYLPLIIGHILFNNLILIRIYLMGTRRASISFNLNKQQGRLILVPKNEKAKFIQRQNITY